MKGKILFILIVLSSLVHAQENNNANFGMNDYVDVYVTRFNISNNYLVNVNDIMGVKGSVNEKEVDYIHIEEETIEEDNSIQEDLESELEQNNEDFTPKEYNPIQEETIDDTQNNEDFTEPEMIIISQNIKKILRVFAGSFFLLTILIYLFYNISKHKENKRIEKEMGEIGLEEIITKR